VLSESLADRERRRDGVIFERGNIRSVEAAVCNEIFREPIFRGNTGEVRVAYEVTARILPCCNNPPRPLSSSRRDASDCHKRAECRVVLREALI